ncbi:myosin heavy chain 95F-like [Contarinia nasturtii]|uniref:myosin heavy chain 95F-like n=1 Tax=Contarinia nasturtii TaxID=265458 RepID=UPI0012D3EE0E|nr:myosin heavy chain 95F-like [Contarinia nasturtii]
MTVDDICELNYLDESSTYASNILIAINPYESIEDLYIKEIPKYNGAYRNLPPHIYATGITSEVGENMKISKNQQSILITGVSGSGKTENAFRIIEFLCRTSHSSVSKDIAKSCPIMDAFGNARTSANANSSRFCKLIELFYNEEFNQSGANIQYHLLEVNRVCARNSRESNFHVFYLLLFGAPSDLLNKIMLNSTIIYQYLPDKEFVKNSYNDSKFNAIDTSLHSFGLTRDEINSVYMVLSAILNLGNIQFEANEDESCYITSVSECFLDNSAHLLNIDTFQLKDALTNRSREISGQQIKSPLTKGAAEKIRDSLSKSLYNKLFSQLIQYINNFYSTPSSSYSIGIMDIAGFECLTEMDNTFDQLCINYANERMQEFFIDRTLLKEKQWYDAQELDIDFVSFFNNNHIVGYAFCSMH